MGKWLVHKPLPNLAEDKTACWKKKYLNLRALQMAQQLIRVLSKGTSNFGPSRSGFPFGRAAFPLGEQLIAPLGPLGGPDRGPEITDWCPGGLATQLRPGSGERARSIPCVDRT